VESSSLLGYAEDAIRSRKRERKKKERGRERERERERERIAGIFSERFAPLYGVHQTVLTHTNHSERESQGT